MDMSSKACSGTREIEAGQPTENLSHVIQSCMVHFGRNIDQAIGKRNTSPFAKRMHELATARSPAEYESIIAELSRLEPEVIAVLLRNKLIATSNPWGKDGKLGSAQATRVGKARYLPSTFEYGSVRLG
ncbi:hypothetical protein E4U13_002219 [Claviceps humidiphila]|uniref:Uncharacterized protein n=1 Tax=Claviceps humidiphila TaxID=1294629 RepID=A0A9P7Q1T5_9HYPO|nr:hypothetical protein E4U13_002219 [Claviceps humidiphila]